MHPSVAALAILLPCISAYPLHDKRQLLNTTSAIPIPVLAPGQDATASTEFLLYDVDNV
jgi:hypothetical protein